MNKPIWPLLTFQAAALTAAGFYFAGAVGLVVGAGTAALWVWMIHDEI